MSVDPRHLIGRLPAWPRSLDSADLAAFCAFYELPVSGLAAAAGACRQQLSSLEIGSWRIAVHRWLPRQACGTLIIVHGYLDHHALYGHLIRYGLERGLAVLCFDLPGHGLSTGPRADIDDFGDYQHVIDELRTSPCWQELPRPWYWLGQSTGGAIINERLLSQGTGDFDRVALLAPLVRAATWPLVTALHRLMGPWVPRVPRRISATSGDPEFVRFLVRDPLQAHHIGTAWVGALRRWLPRFLALPTSDYRLLVIQGEKDLTVDWRYNLEALRQKFPRQKLLRIPPAGHQLANETPAIRQTYLEWIDADWNLSPGPLTQADEACVAEVQP